MTISASEDRKQDSKKVLIVANTSWNVYNFRLNVIEVLLARGYRVAVLAPVDEYVRYRDAFPEVEHYDLKDLDRDGTNPFLDFKLLLNLLGKYRELKPDLLLHYTIKPNIYGGIAAGLLGYRSIAFVTGLGYPFIHNGLLNFISRNLYRLSCVFQKKIIFENEDDLMLFKERGVFSGEKGMSLKGCGVNVSHFQNQGSYVPNGKTTFTFVGRLLYDKGLREFVEAAISLSELKGNVNFWIIGRIDEGNPSAISKSDLLEWCKHPNISYLGSKEDVRPVIEKSDCVVLPSYREAIARSLTEAMSMEKPVIGTETAGIKEIIDHGINGYLVNLRDSESLAEAMLGFIELDHTARTKMGKAGRKKVLEQFDQKIIAEKIAEIVEEVLTTGD